MVSNRSVGIALPVIDRQQGEWRNGRQRQPTARGRDAGVESLDGPYEQQGATDQIGGGIVEARIVPEKADYRLQVDHHADSVGSR